MNPEDTHEKDPINRQPTDRFERLPPGAEQANAQESLRAALAVARRIHRANQAISPAIQPGSREIWRLSEETKLLEAEALSAWAIQLDILLDADDFTRRWFAFGCVEGGEHQIFQEEGYFYKRNNLAFHTSYLEYVERLILHNWLFPDSLYGFEGLMWVLEDEHTQLRPVVSQKALRGVRGATRRK